MKRGVVHLVLGFKNVLVNGGFLAILTTVTSSILVTRGTCFLIPTGLALVGVKGSVMQCISSSSLILTYCGGGRDRFDNVRFCGPGQGG